MPKECTIRKRLEEYMADHPVEAACRVTLIFAIIVFAIANIHKPDDHLDGIIIELYGMFFDLLVIGCFMFWLNQIGEKGREIQRYEEEIEDLLGWKSEEATRRIVGNIKRLNKRGIAKIRLTNAHLVGADLMLVDLTKSDFTYADLSGARLSFANLSGADLGATSLNHANMRHANLSGAKLFKADLDEANLIEANISGADLTEVDLSKAHLKKLIWDDSTIWPEGFDTSKLPSCHQYRSGPPLTSK